MKVCPGAGPCGGHLATCGHRPAGQPYSVGLLAGRLGSQRVNQSEARRQGSLFFFLLTNVPSIYLAANVQVRKKCLIIIANHLTPTATLLYLRGSYQF